MPHSADPRIFDALILVVDDVAINRRMLTGSLQSHGYKNVITANDGEEAFRLTMEKKPDLVILDLMMPTMDGFMYCEAIRKEKTCDNMPILVQTALSEMQEKLRAFKSGANDYITKPIDPGELCARAQVHLYQKLLLQDLQDYQARMSCEINAAREMQNKLMPSDHMIQMYERVYDMKIAQHFETSSALGGDCWGIRPLSDHRLGIYMFDFSGRGMAAAMNVFRMHTMLQELSTMGSEPGQLLTTLNRHLYALLGRDELATMFYGIIDTQANCLLYASASAPPAMLFTQIQGMPMSLDGRGFPLGALSNATYDTKYIPFIPGDLLVLHSDCLSETQNAKGAFIGDEELKNCVVKALKEQPENPAKQAINALIGALHAHNLQPVFDDNTINAYWRAL